MANRRCFSKDIVCSDDFYDLPISSQALYFHLGMQADDRGYVNNARSIIRIIGSSTGDLEQLINKKFVLVRETNLILIKGWRINNTIQPSRLVETKYTEDLKRLFFDENNSYTENTTDKPCQQIVDTLSTQDNLSKDNIIKDNLIESNISESNLIEDKEDNNSNKKLNSFTQPLVNILIDNGYITKGSMDEISITNFVIEKLLNEGQDPIELKKKINEFIKHLELIDEEEITNKANYLRDYLLDDDNLPF